MLLRLMLMIMEEVVLNVGSLDDVVRAAMLQDIHFVQLQTVSCVAVLQGAAFVFSLHPLAKAGAV